LIGLRRFETKPALKRNMSFPLMSPQADRTFVLEEAGLLDDFAGKGQPVGNVPRGQPGFKERVDFGQVIGEINGQPTTKGIIHYSKDGAHLVPANP